jgi:hypothetical protein
MFARVSRTEGKSSLNRFWLPGAFGSFAAAPTVPGWAYTTCGCVVLFHELSAGFDIGRQQFRVGHLVQGVGRQDGTGLRLVETMINSPGGHAALQFRSAPYPQNI